MFGHSLIKTEALSLDFVHYVGDVVGSRVHLIHAEKPGRVENLYDCDGYEDGGGRMMTSPFGRCCDDETHSMSGCDCDDAAKGYASSTLA
jgi:hypothetical protein